MLKKDKNKGRRLSYQWIERSIFLDVVVVPAMMIKIAKSTYLFTIKGISSFKSLDFF